MGTAMDLTGFKIGKLEVLEFVESRKYGSNNRRFYRAKCECGGEIIALGESLKTGRTRSCGCLRCPSGSDNKKWTGCGEISGNYWDHIKRGALLRNFEFTVDIEHAWSLFLSQQRKCAISGILLNFADSQKKKSKFGTASFDRIDSKIGYVVGNVQWLHKDVNRMKQHYDEVYFIEMCNTSSEHQSSLLKE